MTPVYRSSLIALCVAVFLYLVLTPFMNPAPFALAFVFVGVLVAAIVSAVQARRDRAANTGRHQ